jgi:hypothetical protein
MEAQFIPIKWNILCRLTDITPIFWGRQRKGFDEKEKNTEQRKERKSP